MKPERPMSELLTEYPDPPKIVVEKSPGLGWEIFGTQAGRTRRMGRRFTKRGAERFAVAILRSYERWVERVRKETVQFGGPPNERES